VLISAADILSENRTYRAEIVDPLQLANANRISLLADIEQNAKEFVEEFLFDLDLPTPARVRIGNMRGFESIKNLEKVSGYIVANVEFKTDSGHLIRIALPVPVSRGFFYTPSVMNIDGKIRVFSSDIIYSIIASFENKVAILNNIYSADPKITRIDNVKREMFTPPPSGIESKMGLDPM
jgi:hypothetical protein